MFKIIEPVSFTEHHKILDQMYELRARIFRNRLGWDVTVTNRREIDGYDSLGPTYLVLADASGDELVASARFMPSTGPTLLTDVFHETLPEGRDFFSPTIWECTRFCIDEKRAIAHFGRTALFQLAQRMFLACGDFALANGIDTLIVTIDGRMLRILRRTGIDLDVLESTDKLGSRRVYSAIIPVSSKERARLGQALGISGCMISPLVRQAVSCARAIPIPFAA